MLSTPRRRRSSVDGKINNDSGRDTTVNLSADAPKNMQVSYTEAYGSQQLTSIPIEAGKSKDVEASLTMEDSTESGTRHADLEVIEPVFPLEGLDHVAQ